MTKRPRIGLALGSGAARGLAHIGVLKVLEQRGIDIACIAGTSIGGLIGALYAAGVSPAQMEEVALNVHWRKLTSLVDPIFPTSGLIDGKKLSAFIAEILPPVSFEQLRIPLALSATDVETGEALTIRKGNLHEGIRATISFPGLFTPVRFGDRFLVDGGLCNPVPVDMARTLGADRVIGVCTVPEVEKKPSETSLPKDSSEPAALLDFFTSRSVEKALRTILQQGRSLLPGKSAEEARKMPSLFKVCAQSVAIMENEITRLRLEKDEADLFIRPQFNGVTLLEFHRAKEIIAAGEDAAHLALQQLDHWL